VVGTILASGLAKLGGQRSNSSHQPSASLASYVPGCSHLVSYPSSKALRKLSCCYKLLPEYSEAKKVGCKPSPECPKCPEFGFWPPYKKAGQLTRLTHKKAHYSMRLFLG
jgi:hypothetical protein